MERAGLSWLAATKLIVKGGTIVPRVADCDLVGNTLDRGAGGTQHDRRLAERIRGNGSGNRASGERWRVKRLSASS
jgi:hypothetical protein